MLEGLFWSQFCRKETHFNLAVSNCSPHDVSHQTVTSTDVVIMASFRSRSMREADGIRHSFLSFSTRVCTTTCWRSATSATTALSRQASEWLWQKQLFCLVFTRESRMLRASLPSSGRLSVCLSVTFVDCIKTVQARITKSLLWAAPSSLVYRDKISCHWVQGFPSNESVEEEYPPEKTSFCHCWLE